MKPTLNCITFYLFLNIWRTLESQNNCVYENRVQTMTELSNRSKTRKSIPPIISLVVNFISSFQSEQKLNRQQVKLHHLPYFSPLAKIKAKPLPNKIQFLLPVIKRQITFCEKKNHGLQRSWKERSVLYERGERSNTFEVYYRKRMIAPCIYVVYQGICPKNVCSKAMIFRTIGLCRVRPLKTSFPESRMMQCKAFLSWLPLRTWYFWPAAQHHYQSCE